MTVTNVSGCGRQKGIALQCGQAREGDGMIFVLPVENAIRVRTSDNGELCVAGK